MELMSDSLFLFEIYSTVVDFIPLLILTINGSLLIKIISVEDLPGGFDLVADNTDWLAPQ